MGVIRNAESLGVLTESESKFKISQVIQMYIKFEERCSTELEKRRMVGEM